MTASKATKATKATKAAATGFAATAAQVANAVTANATAGTVARRPAIAYTNGQCVTAAGATIQLHGALATFEGSLPATNPANRGKAGNVAKTGELTVGNGKGPKAGHNLVMWQAILDALENGPQTHGKLTEVCGHPTFVRYCLKHGWLTA